MTFSIGGSIFVQKIFSDDFDYLEEKIDRADFPTYLATLYKCPKSGNFTCSKLKLWYFEDFFMLNPNITFIYLAKSAKTAKN